MKSFFTHYEDMEGDKVPKMGWFGVVRGTSKSLEITPFDRAHKISY